MTTQHQPSHAIEEQIHGILLAGLNPQMRKLTADLDGHLVERIVSALTDHPSGPGASHPRDDLAVVAVRVIIGEARGAVGRLLELRKLHDAFDQRFASAISEDERRGILLTFAELLGTTRRGIRGDRRATRRFFGRDAMDARFRRRIGDQFRRLSVLLDRLGVAARHSLGEVDLGHDPSNGAAGAVAAWDSLAIEGLALSVLDAGFDPRVSVEAFRCFATALQGLPEAHRADVMGTRAIQTVYRHALDRSADVWLQCEALSLLRTVDLSAFCRVVELRFASPPDGDDLFVRHHLVGMMAAIPTLRRLLEDVAAHDGSAYVRQAVAWAIPVLADGDSDLALRLAGALARGDAEPSVRAAALLALRELAAVCRDGDIPGDVGAVLERCLREEGDAFALRVTIEMSSGIHELLDSDHRLRWREIVNPVLHDLHAAHEAATVRRWAAKARERIWCDASATRRNLLDHVREIAVRTAPGTRGHLCHPAIDALDDIEIGRVLSVAAQTDFGFDASRSRGRLRFVRGHRFGTRLWRILHEFHHPSPDKRQGFRHTIGRIFEGDLRVPSTILSEMSMTKVPGEPLTLANEGGWRPELPLVDDLLSVLDENSRDRPLRIVTSEGVTTVAPPTTWRGCLAARVALTRRFAHFARLRNEDDPASYIEAVRGLGFMLEMSPHPDEESASDAECDPAESASVGSQASRHSSIGSFALAALPNGADWERIGSYFYSVYENTLGQLLVFLVAAAVFFLGRHILANAVFARSRRRLSLVVGGWGTRGKSGTERIKSALFNALGHRLVAKTTGCEAMFLYADDFGPLHELMLFRPYDKATVWEQTDVVNLAARLDTRVFLWECMGLTPHYVEVLQRQWMKDDLSTIVNTYPDHEDLQGPAGINIPEVMTCFMRENGHVLTSEQQMTPILEAAARRLDSRFDKVGWIEPGLLTPDVLARFPYAEHPNNIALAVEMGRQLGLSPSYSLKEMADRVVPDLGVLKVYPPASIMGRRLQFINGCSANERFGALGNWKRLEFDRHDPAREPDVFISVLVNNRADRIARSRVFASILTDDIAFDRLILIGSNLDGMLGYIREALEARVQSLTLFQKDGAPPAAVFRSWARRWRIPVGDGELAARCAAVGGADSGGAAEGGDAAAEWTASFESLHSEYRAFADRLDRPEVVGDRDALDAEFRALLKRWFEARIVVVWDFHATGDEVIRTIAESTPPGFTNRVMGMQNIKGTGLDFVYRWQAWDVCHEACRRLEDADPRTVRAGVATLTDFNEFGLLCEDAVLGAIAAAQDTHGRGDPILRAQLEAVSERLSAQMVRVRSRLATSIDRPQEGRRARIRAAALRFLEEIVDSLDAIGRRGKADRIYRDLRNERISPARAAYEIQKLNKRQKGGWLAARAG